ncbi:MAG: hypothetical protein QXK76_01840 [Candidatus Woesearchaeota archaeon]
MMITILSKRNKALKESIEKLIAERDDPNLKKKIETSRLPRPTLYLRDDPVVILLEGTRISKIFSRKFFQKRYDKMINMLKQKIDENNKEIAERESQIERIVNMEDDEYTLLEKEIKDSIKNYIKRSNCGCTRTSARDILSGLYEFNSLIVYDSLEKHLFSYCEVTKGFRSFNNDEVLESLMDASLVAISKMKKKSIATEKLLNNIELIASSAEFNLGEYDARYPERYEFADRAFKILSEECEKASAEGRNYHAYRIAKIIEALSYSEEMKVVSKELKNKYCKDALKEILSDKNMDLESKKRYIKNISLSDKVSRELYRFEEMTKKLDSSQKIKNKIDYTIEEIVHSKNRLISEIECKISEATGHLNNAIEKLEGEKKKYEQIKGGSVIDEIKEKETQKFEKQIEETYSIINQVKRTIEDKYNPLIKKHSEFEESLRRAIQKINDRTMTREEYKRLQHELRLYK